MTITSNRRTVATAIRHELKATLGLTSKDVTVRSRSGSLSDAVDVTVLSSAVDVAAVERIALAHERVRTCEHTGETLSGGNLYITVERG